MPWWGWLGGLVGASYVTVSLLAVPEIGAAPTIALMLVVGAMLLQLTR
jgi:bacterial/archaeal transporter family-2 protein